MLDQIAALRYLTSEEVLNERSLTTPVIRIVKSGQVYVFMIIVCYEHDIYYSIVS